MRIVGGKARLPVAGEGKINRRIARIALSGLALAAVAGCETEPRGDRPRPVISAVQSKTDIWSNIASREDAQRLANVTGAWAAGLADARRAGFVSALREEGTLLRTDGGLARPAPTPGSYNCRLIRLGSTGRGKPAFERFKPFYCYIEVEGELLTIVKQTGSTRPAGRLWEDDDPRRLIFLGSLALGDEQVPLAYGEDRRRDMAGILERVAPFRWRLVIPWPQDGAKLYLFELTPVADQPR